MGSHYFEAISGWEESFYPLPKKYIRLRNHYLSSSILYTGKKLLQVVSFAVKDHINSKGLREIIPTPPALSRRKAGLIQPDRDDLRYPGRFHGDSVEGVRHLHRLLVMGDENEL